MAALKLQDSQRIHENIASHKPIPASLIKASLLHGLALQFMNIDILPALKDGDSSGAKHFHA